MNLIQNIRLIIGNRHCLSTRKKIIKLIEDQSIILRKSDGRFIRLVKEMYFKEMGPNFQNCNLNLKDKFSLKDNYIEVHHINEFSNSPLLKKEYENLSDVMKDFEFLCPNCHKSRHLKKLN